MHLGRTVVKVMPPAYELPLGFIGGVHRWCRLDELVDVVCGLSRAAGTDFVPTPEDLVTRFVAATHINQGVESDPRPAGEQPSIFRYSVDGCELHGARVPRDCADCPPHVDFVLEIGTPYPQGMYVPERWARLVTKGVRVGAVAAVRWGEVVVGLPWSDSGHRAFVLDGADPGAVLYRPPSCCIRV